MKTLVFAPHPDDEIIGCGGYLAKLIAANNQVDVVYLTVPSEVRKVEIEEVKKFVGFSTVYLLDESERLIMSNESLLKKILHSIRESKPDQLVLPHRNESDRDHRQLAEIVSDCIYLASSDFLLAEPDEPHKVCSALGYEVWTPISSPQLHVDITDFMEIKRQAMQLYGSQLRQKDFIAMFQGLNKFRAITTGGNGYTEAFEIYLVGEKEVITGGTND